MKARTILAVAAAAITLTSSALVETNIAISSRKDIVGSTADGLYACVSKDDVQVEWSITLRRLPR